MGDCRIRELSVNNSGIVLVIPRGTRKADDKVCACKIAKTISTKMYHIERSKTVG